MWSLRYQSQSEGVVSEDAVGSALKTRWSYRVFALKKRWVRVRGFDVGGGGWWTPKDYWWLRNFLTFLVK